MLGKKSMTLISHCVCHDNNSLLSNILLPAPLLLTMNNMDEDGINILPDALPVDDSLLEELGVGYEDFLEYCEAFDEEWLLQQISSSGLGFDQNFIDNYAYEEVHRSAVYQRKAHKRAFGDNPNDKLIKRRELVKKYKTQKLSIRITIDGGEIDCNLGVLASQSDLVLALKRHNDTMKCCSDTVALHLDAFDSVAVRNFLDLVWNFERSEAARHFTDSWEDKIDFGLRMLHSNMKTYDQSSDEDQYPLVDITRIAHYLQCMDILEACVRMLGSHISTENCLSLYRLADELHLEWLSEMSLKYMLTTVVDLRSQDIWNDLGMELQNHIVSVKGILKGQGKLTLYFSSFAEYIAIFAERVEYHREQLAEAKLQQKLHAERIEEEQQLGNEPQGHQSFTTHDLGPAWHYAQSKIEVH